MINCEIIVYGRVQGVGFRFYTYQTAVMNGINGWVKNNIDGTVKIVAQGKKSNMNKFINALRRGSHFSKVEDISLKEIQPPKNYKTFNIKY